MNNLGSKKHESVKSQNGRPDQAPSLFAQSSAFFPPAEPSFLPSEEIHSVIFDIGFSEAKEAVEWGIFKNPEELFWASRSKYQLGAPDVKEFKAGVRAYLESINYKGCVV